MTLEIPEGHFLVAYDYGTGGLWWFVKADSADEIRRASADLIVLDAAPSWMRMDTWNHITTDELHNPRSEALKMILAGQN